MPTISLRILMRPLRLGRIGFRRLSASIAVGDDLAPKADEAPAFARDALGDERAARCHPWASGGG